MQWLLGVTIKVFNLDNWGFIERINPSAGWASREQGWKLGQKSVLGSFNDCYRLADSQWLVVGLGGFGLFLYELLDPQVPGFLSPSSQIPNVKSEIEANAQMLEQVMYLLMMEVVFLWDTRTMWTYTATIWRLTHRTLYGIQREFVGNSRSGSRSVGRVQEKMTG